MNTEPEKLTQNNLSPPLTVGATGRKIVYDKDGKPCRSCNTLLDFQMATGKVPAAKIQHQQSVLSEKTQSQNKNSTSETENGYRQDPPDVELLGRSSWTFMHSLCAKYPEKPTGEDKDQISSFFNLLGRMYPCDWCAEDFSKYLTEHQVDTSSREGLNMWLCGAHNAVNRKLGKKEFDCNLWKKRWVDGWD